MTLNLAPNATNQSLSPFKYTMNSDKYTTKRFINKSDVKNMHVAPGLITTENELHGRTKILSGILPNNVEESRTSTSSFLAVPESKLETSLDITATRTGKQVYYSFDNTGDVTYHRDNTASTISPCPVECKYVVRPLHNSASSRSNAKQQDWTTINESFAEQRGGLSTRNYHRDTSQDNPHE